MKYKEGDWNSGDMNSGDRNSGNWNSGNWNSGNWNSGYMNSGEPPIRIFGKETNITLGNIDFPKYFYFESIKWIKDGSICGGHLETLNYKDAWRQSWDNAGMNDRRKTEQLPNFNNEMFLKITGIDYEKEMGKTKDGRKRKRHKCGVNQIHKTL